MHQILLSKYFREELKQRISGKGLPWEGPIGFCLVTISPLSLTRLNLEENRCWTRKRIKFQIRRLFINLTEEPAVSCSVSPADTALRMAGGV